MIDNKKLKLQEEIIEVFKQNNYKGTVVLPTGTGKSYLAFLIIKKILDKNSNKKILIIVDRIPLKKQWETEYLKGISNVDVLVINSALKLDLSNYSFAICDEIDTYIDGVYFSTIFNKLPYFKLGLTATVTPNQENKLIKFGLPIIFRLDIKKAIEENFIGDKSIINIGIPLSDFETSKVLNLKQLIRVESNRIKGYFYLNLLSDAELRKEASAKLNLDSNMIFGITRKITKLVNEKNNILENNTKKIKFIKQIRKLHNESIITFSKWTTFSDLITNNFKDSKSYHSYLEDIRVNDNYEIDDEGKIFTVKEQKETLITLFKEKKIRQLNTVNSVVRGLNITDLRIGIRTSGTANESTFKQMLGRLRSNNSILYCLYMIYNNNKTTDEEKKLIEAQQNLNLPINNVGYEQFINSL